jgi:hypothetical protein
MATAKQLPLEEFCRYCGCSENRACILGLGLFDQPQTCSWVDSTKTVCNNPRCLREHRAASTGKKKKPAAMQSR